MVEHRSIYIPELNCLRSIFMLVIFFHHMNGSTMFPPGGYIAVAFFFVLSGFSMTIGYRERVMQTTFSYRHYILRRIGKFYPIHWLVLFIMLVLSFLGSKTLYSCDMFWPKLASNFILLQSFIPIKDFYFSFNSPSWYISNTLFYCFLFPFILKGLIQTSKSLKKVFFLALVVLYVLLILLIPSDYRHAILYISPFVRIIDFLFGIYTGLLFLYIYEGVVEKMESRAWWFLIVVVSFVVLAIFSFCDIEKSIRYYTNYLYWIVSCPIVLAISVLSVFKKHETTNSKYASKLLIGGGKILQWAGGYSFTFYMLHLRCIDIMNSVCAKFAFGISVKVVLTLIFTMIMSILCQKFFVEPVGKYLIKK